MARSSGVDWANLASNVYQNRQLAEQTAQGEVMMAQMEQQVAMQRMKEAKHQNIVEARKTVVKLDKFADKSLKVADSYPEYSLMMTGLALGVVNSTGLNSDFFEEITDMERAGQMNEKLDSAESSIRTSMSDDQISDSRKMQKFLDKGEDEMEALAKYCVMNEDWSKNSAEFEELDPLHQERNGFKKWLRMIGGILLFIPILMVATAVSGECLAYDADDYCTSYENDGEPLYQGTMTLGMAVMFLGWVPGWVWSRKYLKQWAPLNEQHEEVKSVENKYLALSDKHGTTSSEKISEMRSSMIAWVEKLTPSDSSMLLEL